MLGGRDGSFAPLKTSQLFGPTSNLFAVGGDMTTTRALPTATLLGEGRVLVTGGQSSSSPVGPTSSAEIYNGPL